MLSLSTKLVFRAWHYIHMCVLPLLSWTIFHYSNFALVDDFLIFILCYLGRSFDNQFLLSSTLFQYSIFAIFEVLSILNLWPGRAIYLHKTCAFKRATVSKVFPKTRHERLITLWCSSICSKPLNALIIYIKEVAKLVTLKISVHMCREDSKKEFVSATTWRVDAILEMIEWFSLVSTYEMCDQDLDAWNVEPVSKYLRCGISLYIFDICT